VHHKDRVDQRITKAHQNEVGILQEKKNIAYKLKRKRKKKLKIKIEFL
jgi:hypothetical protein